MLAGNKAYQIVDGQQVEAIYQDKVGLTLLPSDPNGHCVQATSAGEGTQVNFREDMRIGCTLPLSFDEVRAGTTIIYFTRIFYFHESVTNERLF